MKIDYVTQPRKGDIVVARNAVKYNQPRRGVISVARNAVKYNQPHRGDIIVAIRQEG